MSTLSEENARALLNVAEQRKQHWSGMIVALNGLAMTLILGIWSFFLKAYFDSYSQTNIDKEIGFSYIIIAAGLSSIILALWRWYVRYLDNQITRLYPEIVYYEYFLGIPHNMGILAYLSCVKNVKKRFSELYKYQQYKMVDKLVEKKRIGRRGHLVFEIIVFIVIVISIALMIYDICILYQTERLSNLICCIQIKNNPYIMSKWAGYLLIMIGFIIQVCTFFYYQREPTQEYIEKVKEKLLATSY